jgi:hypothetical protein
VVHLVEQYVDVLIVDVVEEIIWAELLAPVVPIASKLTRQLLIQPKTDIVAAVIATRTLVQVSVDMDSPITARIAFGHTITIGRGVDVKTGSVALKQALVFNSVPHNVDVKLSERKALEADQDIEPLLERALERLGGRCAGCCGIIFQSGSTARSS